ncbi:MAG: RagB/SusD family nutrient uptake outer membrane protein [Bacteroidales bacterium]|nr:RagB/SusD family nutrient uptake outer membrane protein [Bacteroidales bacterium]
MKKSILYVLAGLFFLMSCQDMYLPPKNTLTDEDLMSSEAGLSIYMSRLYSQMPWEDFKYMAQWGLPRRSSWLGCLGVEGTGEAVNRDGVCTSFRGEDDPWWGSAYSLIRDANKLIEGLPAFKENYSNEAVYNDYIGQAYFVRAYSYYQMARRYGGVPLVTEVIQYPASSDKLEKYRASEEDTWNQVLADFDMAAELMQPTSALRGYANRYVALAFKAEAMLYAGSVAKYNSTVSGNLTGIGSKSGNRVIGFGDNAQELSKKWFAEAYKAAREVMTEGGYSLYKKAWVAGDKTAQYRNMVEMWSDLASPENILVREYEYPTMTHGLDAYSSPFLWHSPLAGGTCPTLDFIELFDGLEYHPDGTLKLTSGSANDKGEYLLFESPMDLFANAEPRLRAYVIFPMDEFRKEVIEVRAGIFTGGTENHVPLLFGDNYSYGAAQMKYADLQAYKGSSKTLYLGAQPTSGIETVEVNGQQMPATGSCGVWQEYYESTITGLHMRKYLNEDMTVEDIGEGKSAQPFILMRYADVLLAVAESAVELAIAGVTSPVQGDDMLAVATEAINDIRERAGADLLTSGLSADEASRNIVRRERRKELAFEHKTKWDLRRWRVQHEGAKDLFWGVEKDADIFSSGSKYRFRALYPFYSTVNDKYFFDAHFVNVRPQEFEFNTIDYYFSIPSGEVSKSAYIDQQPNR